MTGETAARSDDSGEGAPHLIRLLGAFDATMIVAGSMIGSGIFIVSADIARNVGGAGWLLAVWLLGAFMTVAAAKCYAELATMFPHAGGQFVFLREAFGPLAGFLYGWTLFLVIQTGTIAAVAVAFGKFLAVLVPELASAPDVSVLGHPISAQQAVAVLVIAGLTAANCAGLRTGKDIQNVFTVAKVASLVALVLVGVAFGWNGHVVAQNLATAWSCPAHGALLTGFGAAMVGSLFSADAWNNVTFTAAEVRNPERAVPRALVLGTVLVVGLYVLANVAYLVVLPVAGDPAGSDVLARGIAHASQDRVATAVVEQILGPAGASLMAVLIMISTFGCVNGLILTGPRLYHAMAVDGLFVSGLARLNANSVPARALVLQGAWASLLALSGRYGQLLDYVIATALLFYALTVIGLLRLRRAQPSGSRQPGAGASRVAPRSAWLPVTYVILAVLVCADLLVVKPDYTWPGFLIVAAGLPAYLVWRR